LICRKHRNILITDIHSYASNSFVAFFFLFFVCYRWLIHLASCFFVLLILSVLTFYAKEKEINNNNRHIFNWFEHSFFFKMSVVRRRLFYVLEDAKAATTTITITRKKKNKAMYLFHYLFYFICVRVCVCLSIAFFITSRFVFFFFFFLCIYILKEKQRYDNKKCRNEIIVHWDIWK
jgi:hypothetical protein